MFITNHSAVVTGAARGIGKAIALRLAQMGYDIVVNHIAGEEDAAEALCVTLRTKDVKAMAFCADISVFEQANQLVQAAEAFSPIAALVNNAGITRDGLVLRMKEEDFTRVVQVNLTGAFNTIRHAAPLMIRRRSGSIVNISSVVGLMGNVGQANYAASKAGLLGLTKSVAREIAPRGVTVNAVCPGFIESDMTDAMSGEAKANFLKAVPMGRGGTQDEVAGIVAFLCGEDARYVTGHELLIDGGLYM